MPSQKFTHVDDGIVRQSRQTLVQRLVHLLGLALEESTTATDEERVSGEDNLARAILHEVADTVLGVAGSVDALDGDIAKLESFFVGGSLGDTFAILATDDIELRVSKFLQLHSLAHIPHSSIHP